ncbi:MAG: hypothetical protein ABII71_04075 [Candidatus Micrarchaeota archaeon]
MDALKMGEMLARVANNMEAGPLKTELANLAEAIDVVPPKISDELFGVLIGMASIKNFKEWAYRAREPPIALTLGSVDAKKLYEAQVASIFRLIEMGLEMGQARREMLISLYLKTLISMGEDTAPASYEITAFRFSVKSIVKALERVAPEMTETEIAVLLPALAPSDKLNIIKAVERSSLEGGLSAQIREKLVQALSIILGDMEATIEMRKEAHGIQTRLTDGKFIRAKPGPQLGPLPMKPVTRKA